MTTSGGCAAHLSTVIGRERVAELSEYLQNSVRALHIADLLRPAAGLTCHSASG